MNSPRPCSVPTCLACGASSFTGSKSSRPCHSSWRDRPARFRLWTGWRARRKDEAAVRARRTSRLARHAVAEVDDSRAEGAGLDEFEIHPALALGKERNATANQHRVDPGPVLVDQTQRGRLGGERRAAEAAALGLIDEYRARVY